MLKLIEIEEDVKERLEIKAAKEKRTLKNYIELLLIKDSKK